MTSRLKQISAALDLITPRPSPDSDALFATLLDELERRDLEKGLVAISGAAGIGTATIIERV